MWEKILKNKDVDIVEAVYGKYEANDSRARIEGSDAVKNLLRVIDKFNLNYIITTSSAIWGNIITEGELTANIHVDGYRIVFDSNNEKAMKDIWSIAAKYNIMIEDDNNVV